MRCETLLSLCLGRARGFLPPRRWSPPEMPESGCTRSTGDLDGMHGARAGAMKWQLGGSDDTDPVGQGKIIEIRERTPKTRPIVPWLRPLKNRQWLTSLCRTRSRKPWNRWWSPGTSFGYVAATTKRLCFPPLIIAAGHKNQRGFHLNDQLGVVHLGCLAKGLDIQDIWLDHLPSEAINKTDAHYAWHLIVW